MEILFWHDVLFSHILPLNGTLKLRIPDDLFKHSKSQPRFVIFPKNWKRRDWFLTCLSIVSKIPSIYFQFFSSKISLMHSTSRHNNSIFLRKEKNTIISSMHTKYTDWKHITQGVILHLLTNILSF